MRLSENFGRYRWLIIIICLSLVQNTFARTNTKFRDRYKFEHTELNKIVATPNAYIGRVVTFTCRFGFQANFFKAFNTKFNRREHTNFAVWDDDVKLWDKDERRTVLPSLYVDVSNKKLIEKLLKLKKYELVVLTAEITSSYGSLPWFEVTEINSQAWKDKAPTDVALLHIRNGLALEKEKKYLLAAEHFKMALEKGLPTSYKGFVNTRLGTNYYLAKKYDLASEALATASKLSQSDAELKISQAELCLKQEKYEDAVNFCKDALKISAAYPEAYAIMGESLGKSGDYNGGLKLCSLAINNPGISAENKANAEVHKARVYLAARNYNEAIRSYANAIGVTSPLASASWLRIEIGRLYEERYTVTGDTELLKEAIREYKNAVTITKESDVESMYLLANAYFKETMSANGTNYQKSVDLLDKVRALDPAYVPALVLAAKIAELQGNSEEAGRIYNRIVEENPTDADAYLAVAKVYHADGKLEKAAEAYQKSAELNPSSIKTFSALAEINESLGKLDDAKENYKKLVDLDPEETVYHLRLAKLSLNTDDYNTAISEGKKAIVSGIQGVEARMVVSKAYEAKNDLASAANQLELLLEENDADNPIAAAYRAYLLAEIGKSLDAALELAMKAISAMPEYAEAKDALGWIQYKMGEQEKAESTLLSVMEENRTRSLWYHIGVVSHALEKYEQATKALESAATPVLADEIKAVAEKIKEAAEKLLPVVEKDQDAAKRKKELEEKVEAIRKQEEERVLREAMENARKEAARQVESVFEEAKLPEDESIKELEVVVEEEVIVKEEQPEEESVPEKMSLNKNAEVEEVEELSSPEIIEDKISFRAKFRELEEEVALMYPERVEGPELGETENVEAPKSEFALCWSMDESMGCDIAGDTADSVLAAMAGPELEDNHKITEKLDTLKPTKAEISLKELPTNEVVILPEWTF